MAVLLAGQLVVAAAGVALLRAGEPAGVAAAAVRARVAVTLDPARERAVRALLARRAAALAGRNRQAWLADVDPAAGPFRQRQGALFDNLAGVPLRNWSYRLDPASGLPSAEAVDARRGAGWWAPAVTLTYQLAGFDDVPTAESQRLTFVPRGDRWYLAADDDFAASGQDTPRGLWDSGPVAVVRGSRSLVLGHPGSGLMMRLVAAGLDAAVPRVSAVWGSDWSRRVVALVPGSQEEVAQIVGRPGKHSQIAALTTSQRAGSAAVGERIVVNPAAFGRLGALGRRVVLTHELTHVATGSATGPKVPAWLAEGFADYVGYLGLPVSYRVAAAELRADVHSGRGPRALPADGDFDGGNVELPAVYEQAWLAVTLLAEAHGRSALVDLYREVGAGTSLDQALRTRWGTDLQHFTASWRRDLSQRLQ